MAQASVHINDRDACSAKLYMLVFKMGNIRDCAQILSNELAQDAVTFPMQNSDSLYSHKNGIVDEILNCIESFITAHASHVDILMETLPSLIDGGLCDM